MPIDSDFAYTVLTALGVGTAFGYVAQRGRFCMNSAMRNVILLRDFLLFRTYLLALCVAVAGTQALLAMGLVEGVKLKEFYYAANIIGGLVFGIGVVLAGGCDSGSMYRMGEGMLGSWAAVYAFGLGAAATGVGVFSGLRTWLRSFQITVDGDVATLVNLLGWNRWIFVSIAVFFAVLGLILGRKEKHQKGWGWRASGVGMGAIIPLAWFFSARAEYSFGFTFSGPTANLFTYASAGIPWTIDWGMLALAGVPLGAFIGAIRGREFKWRVSPPPRLIQQFAGGLIMGFGARLAGGCTIGQGLTNSAMLTVGSLVTMVFIVLGAWAMVYIMFMRE